MPETTIQPIIEIAITKEFAPDFVESTGLHIGLVLPIWQGSIFYPEVKDRHVIVSPAHTIDHWPNEAGQVWVKCPKFVIGTVTQPDGTITKIYNYGGYVKLEAGEYAFLNS